MYRAVTLLLVLWSFLPPYCVLLVCSPLFYNWFIRQHERKCVSFLSGCHWFWWGTQGTSLFRTRNETDYFTTQHNAFVNLLNMSSVNTFKFSWLTPLWWGCPAPTGSACRSRRRLRWRTRRCCRWSPPSSRTRHSRLPEVDSLIAIFPVYSLAFCPALQQPMPVLASGSGQQESPRSQQVRSSGHRRWSEAGQSPHTWPGGHSLLGGAIL